MWFVISIWPYWSRREARHVRERNSSPELLLGRNRRGFLKSTSVRLDVFQMAVPRVIWRGGVTGVLNLPPPHLAFPATALTLGFLSVSHFWLRNINYYCCELSLISPASRPFRLLTSTFFLSRPLFYGAPRTNITYLLDPELSNNYVMYTAIHIVPRVDLIVSKGKKE